MLYVAITFTSARRLASIHKALFLTVDLSRQATEVVTRVQNLNKSIQVLELTTEYWCKTARNPLIVKTEKQITLMPLNNFLSKRWKDNFIAKIPAMKLVRCKTQRENLPAHDLVFHIFHRSTRIARRCERSPVNLKRFIMFLCGKKIQVENGQLTPENLVL